ncbi:golgin candidate 5 isoform X2 [Medicago truncatula]|uniref:golgin candidate 5 isoform X2 n=1 Tax=Medicago truncatula TaxID=3880 RepID=UPI0019687870|nr:golgin candidate 5 isoform X2 [Medicago truncatula]
MAWFIAKNAPGDFLNYAGAVNKLMESEKNIEKNFDTALSFEEKGEFSHEDSFYLRSVNMLQESGKNIEKHFDNALGFEEKRESGNEGNLYLRSVNMLPDSVMNIEKNFDTALEFEEKGESNNEDSILELERVKREIKMMEAALLGAARQAQAKADEIEKLMNENEEFKHLIEDLMRKSNEAEVESLRQKVSTLERKVDALTKERDTLRREQSKKSDSDALLKEKDEIINQVMDEDKLAVRIEDEVMGKKGSVGLVEILHPVSME